MNENTTQSILDALAAMAARKEVIDPNTWMEAGAKINALLQGEQNQKHRMEYELAKIRADLIGEGKTAAHAKTLVESNPLWVVYKDQCVLIERAIETIRLAKQNARLASELMRNNI